MSALERLIDAIGSFHADDVFNPWLDRDPLDVGDGPAGRRERLANHFDCHADLLLIGEAPGYQGCHFSGIAFTNESLLLAGAVPRVVCPMRITMRGRPWSEPSASIVWRTLHKLGIAGGTVLWNAFAWHPHRPGEPYTNRAPTAGELIEGRPILEAICDHFAGARIVAVGRVAERALALCGIVADAAVRHPSMGGANAFRAGLAAMAANVAKLAGRAERGTLGGAGDGR